MPVEISVIQHSLRVCFDPCIDPTLCWLFLEEESVRWDGGWISCGMIALWDSFLISMIEGNNLIIF